MTCQDPFIFLFQIPQQAFGLSTFMVGDSQGEKKVGDDQVYQVSAMSMWQSDNSGYMLIIRIPVGSFPKVNQLLNM